jgi:hypothetical protein
MGERCNGEGWSPGVQNDETSMPTRSVVPAHASSRVLIAGKAKNPNALVGSVWPGVSRRWLTTWLPRVEALVTDHRDESANRQRIARQLTLR